MKSPIPDDWNEESDGYALLLLCIPNSQLWRATVRGRIADIAGGRVWDERTGRVTDVQAIGREIFDSMAICKLDDLLVEFKRLNAILAGEVLSLTIDGQPVEWDYQENGLVPTLAGLDATLADLELTANVTNNIEPSPVTVQVDPAPVEVYPAATVEIDLATVVSKLEELRTMLETRLVAETTAANSRSASEQALLDAIENILGGSYEP